MKLSPNLLRVHLAHCALHPRTGREIGLIFTADGTPCVMALPRR
jgi:hypothetical protein